MPWSPLEPKLRKAERKTLARRLRMLLSRGPMSMGQIAAVLEVDPETVVVALRTLRARKRGRLRSTIRFGHVSWWWEEPPARDAGPAGTRPEAGEQPPEAIGGDRKR